MFETAGLLELTDTIYGGVFESSAWEDAIGVWCRAFGGYAGALSLHDTVSHDVNSVTFIDIDQDYRRTYAELIRLPDMNGAFRAVAASANLGAITGSELALAAPDFERSRFRDEWQKPQHVPDYVAVPLAPSPSVAGGLFIARPRRGDD